VDSTATPERPQYPEPLTAQSTANDIGASNLKHVLLYGTEDDKWFLHLNPIAFKDGAAKTNWRSFDDTRAFDTFASWLSAKMTIGKKLDSQVGFFCTWTKTWVGTPPAEWKTLPWHAWGAVLQRHQELGRGKELIIWDSNCQCQHGDSTTVSLSRHAAQPYYFPRGQGQLDEDLYWWAREPGQRHLYAAYLRVDYQHLL
jgi:hypothetical protein